MIPADVASRLQLSADTALRPVAPAQEIADKLSGLVAGQKVMAEIQSMLPNGTYRALIDQRSITLALPFSAKSGDSLELQVTESDGKLALAVVAPQDDGGKPAAASTSATLSRTGQMISTLFSEASDAKGGPVTTMLNASEPISATPVSAQDLLPQLKQAIVQSGMFYESHQAEWVEGRFAKSELLQEPQGKLSSPAAFVSAEPMADSAGQAAKVALSAGESAGVLSLADSAPASDASKISATPTTTTQTPAQTAAQSASQAQAPGQLVAPQAQALVQQQLEALASQNFSWQGQIWPGQEMRWEIDEDAARQGAANDGTAPQWTTRLNLTLPKLGEVNAQIRLQGNQITLSMTAGSAETRTLMRASGVALRSQLNEAGISLASMGVSALTTEPDDGQAGQ